MAKTKHQTTNKKMITNNQPQATTIRDGCWQKSIVIDIGKNIIYIFISL